MLSPEALAPMSVVVLAGFTAGLLLGSVLIISMLLWG